jgi:pimeloyl-ACP methyl ester carboxylesterase
VPLAYIEGPGHEDDAATVGPVPHIYDTGAGDLPVFYLHGTPNTGEPPAPLSGDASRLGIRWIGYDRPGYRDNPRVPGRDVASAVADVRRIADDLGLDRFAVFGHSGGGPPALACGALLPDRVGAVVSISGPAPFDADGLDWFAGMRTPGSLRAAAAGRAAKEAYEASPPDDEEVPFTPADWAALAGPWSWFGPVVSAALAGGRDGLIDDDLSAVSPWGFAPADVTPPVLIVHGGEDQMIPVSHAHWLAARCPHAELRVIPGEGHISVLREAPAALEWLAVTLRGAPGAGEPAGRR